jgi:hypothetical protein
MGGGAVWRLREHGFWREDGYFFALGAGFPVLRALSEARLPAYNESMAKVWESNSVDAQEAQQETQQFDQSEQLRVQAVADDKERVGRLKAQEARKVQALQLTRARIREQLSRTSNERYTLLLNTELQQIEGELAKLG